MQTIENGESLLSVRIKMNSNFSDLDSGKERGANKSTSIPTDQASDIKFPSVKSVYDWATGLFATIADLAFKAPIASPTFTGTVSGITATMVGAPSGSGTSTGTNSGDNATNTQYSGLATSKADVAGNVTQSFSASQIELGHASDTTISRVGAGIIAVEGATVPTINSISTLTNKRVTKRVVAIAQSATPAINTDNGDVFTITGLAQTITSFTTNLTGTPVADDMMIINITDNGTARAITWGASFEASTIALPTTTVISTLLKVGFIWNSATSKWRVVAVA